LTKKKPVWLRSFHNELITYFSYAISSSVWAYSLSFFLFLPLLFYPNSSFTLYNLYNNRYNYVINIHCLALLCYLYIFRLPLFLECNIFFLSYISTTVCLNIFSHKLRYNFFIPAIFLTSFLPFLWNGILSFGMEYVIV
jgi:hypothetical protein